MASKSSACLALFLALNILFFSLVSAWDHPSPSKGKCPIDTLKLGVCADLLSGLLHITIGTPHKHQCCGFIKGLADLDAGVCLCTAIKANILGIHLDIPLSLSLLLNACDKKAASGFQCA